MRRTRVFDDIRGRLRELLWIVHEIYSQKSCHLFVLRKKGRKGGRLFAKGCVDPDDDTRWWEFYDSNGPSDINLWAQENNIRASEQVQILFSYSNLHLTT